VLHKMAERKKTEEVWARPRKPIFSGPRVILIDGRTGSAGEAFAGFFQAQQKAVVVGDASLGRLMTSSYFAEEFGADKIVYYGVQISIAKVVLPNGDEIEAKGVNPDVACNPSGDDMRERRDVCLDVAVARAREALHLAPVAPRPVDLEPAKN
jgi:carboxyl-terminal processing protease